jgi:hypothetical protein
MRRCPPEPLSPTLLPCPLAWCLAMAGVSYASGSGPHPPRVSCSTQGRAAGSGTSQVVCALLLSQQQRHIQVTMCMHAGPFLIHTPARHGRKEGKGWQQVAGGGSRDINSLSRLSRAWHAMIETAPIKQHALCRSAARHTLSYTVHTQAIIQSTVQQPPQRVCTSQLPPPRHSRGQVGTAPSPRRDRDPGGAGTLRRRLALCCPPGGGVCARHPEQPTAGCVLRYSRAHSRRSTG